MDHIIDCLDFFWLSSTIFVLQKNHNEKACESRFLLCEIFHELHFSNDVSDRSKHFAKLIIKISGHTFQIILFVILQCFLNKTTGYSYCQSGFSPLGDKENFDAKARLECLQFVIFVLNNMGYSCTLDL